MSFLFSLPLLARELTERAARRRTYAGRVIYGLALYTLFLVTVWRLIGSAENDPTGFGALGLGRGIFARLVELQCWGILLFQPALMAGVLTYEKERESFSLLLLTGMSPTKLLLEKYLAGLLPMATLLLLALPLGAITMGYGGVSPQLLASGACVVLAAWLQVGAFSLLCSAWWRTTVGALLASYLGGALLYLAPATIFSLSERYILWGADLRGLDVPGWLWSLWPPEAFARVLAFQENVTATAVTDSSMLWVHRLRVTALLCTPILISTAVFLLLARSVLLPRALSEARSHLPLRYPRLARLLGWATRSLHSFWQKKADLPLENPVAWRESGRSILGRGAHSLEFTGIAAGIALAACLFLAGLYPRTGGTERLSHLTLIVGAAMVLVLVVRSVSSLLSEHANQTLDILLTTPLSAAEILRQKARALGKYWFLLAVTLGVIFLMKGWVEYEFVRSGQRWRELGRYWSCAALALLVYPPLIIWGSLLFAICLRVRLRAIVATLIVFAIWFIAPLEMSKWVAQEWGTGGWMQQGWAAWLSLLSPLGIVSANESQGFENFMYYGAETQELVNPWVPIIGNFIFYTVVLFVLRNTCLSVADRMLRGGGRSG